MSTGSLDSSIPHLEWERGVAGFGLLLSDSPDSWYISNGIFSSLVRDQRMAAIRKALSQHRVLVLDTLYFARSVPTFPVETSFDLSDLAALRRASPHRISWTALFMKAFSLVAQSRPALRQAFIPWPWAHLCQYEQSVATVAIHRIESDDPRLFWGRFLDPAGTALADLQAKLDHFQHEPIDLAFRRQVRFSRLPTFIRRLAWHLGLYWFPHRRDRRFGTFSMSSLAGQGSINRGHPTIHTASLTYGPLDSSGCCLVTLLCDHRVLDGVAAAESLNALHDALRFEITDELRGLQSLRRAA